ncbi:MAG: hydroxylamine reductase [Thermodesulfovibrionales bacterium]|nr:hydroxylamine reductase [Thermodesulfovibrionales bacterium]
MTEQKMFCYQCEQTAKGTGCTQIGVCGKEPDVSALQDLLLYTLKGLSLYANEARKLNLLDPGVDVFTVKALFSTLTNVNFDPDRFVEFIKRAVSIREQIGKQLESAGKKVLFKEEAANYIPPHSKEEMIKDGMKVGIKADPSLDPDILSLQQTLIYGIKGISAYADHAQILGQQDEAIYSFIHEGLSATLRKDIGVAQWLELVLKCGEINLKTMELLDRGHTTTFGHPIPTKVPLGVKKGKAILVSGHDLKDLLEILKLTDGKNIYVYTHGEMLPAHGYPELKKYSHLYGHYGTAWQNQHKEFTKFPGPILMTTNCLQKPLDSYKDNIFTTGVVGWPGIKHVSNDNFKPIVDKALNMEGFQEDVDGKTVMVGFARNTVLGVAEKIVEAVKNKDIRHFFLVAGCDGAKPGRNYYTEFVEKVPKDCIVLTLACGKFRFFDKELGDIGGIPRLLDVGQCNDAYSAIQIALSLSKAFNVGVNELPLSLILSWYEQKAVAILLTLLSLNIKNIRLGPSLPAFVTPNILDVLVKNFNIKPITTPDEDLKAILG